jgi:hypothetical protein
MMAKLRPYSASLAPGGRRESPAPLARVLLAVVLASVVAIAWYAGRMSGRVAALRAEVTAVTCAEPHDLAPEVARLRARAAALALQLAAVKPCKMAPPPVEPLPKVPEDEPAPVVTGEEAEQRIHALASATPGGPTVDSARCDDERCSLEIVAPPSGEVDAVAVQGFAGRLAGELAFAVVQVAPAEGRASVVLSHTPITTAALPSAGP